MSEHPVDQLIVALDPVPSPRAFTYRVGFDGVTRIEATTKSGMHADIPYIRVWAGDVAIAEFCQHNIHAIYFDAA